MFSEFIIYNLWLIFTRTKTKKKVHFEKIPTKEREWFTEVIEPSFSHGVTYNACVALIADVDEDKKNELIVGTSSREVHTYSLGIFSKFLTKVFLLILADNFSKDRTK